LQRQSSSPTKGEFEDREAGGHGANPAVLRKSLSGKDEIPLGVRLASVDVVSAKQRNLGTHENELLGVNHRA
jgi:hypothetical protein